MVDPDEPREGESRLQRWSRLKREAQAEKTKVTELSPAPLETQTAALAPAVPVVPATQSETDKPEEQKKIDDIVKDLPPLESLGKDSNYSLFMREGVPEEMRTAALRKLWRSDPSFLEQFPYEMHMEDYNKTFVPMNAATDTIFRAGLGYLFEDEKDKVENSPSAEFAVQSAPDGTEIEGMAASESAKSLPAITEEIAQSNLAKASGRAETPEGEKFPSRKS